MSATVSNLCHLARWLNAETYDSAESRPRELLEFVVCGCDVLNKAFQQVSISKASMAVWTRLRADGAVLCCAVLCCAVLCCAVLCCAVLCCAVLCSAVLCR